MFNFIRPMLFTSILLLGDFSTSIAGDTIEDTLEEKKNNTMLESSSHHRNHLKEESPVEHSNNVQNQATSLPVSEDREKSPQKNQLNPFTEEQIINRGDTKQTENISEKKINNTILKSSSHHRSHSKKKLPVKRSNNIQNQAPSQPVSEDREKSAQKNQLNPIIEEQLINRGDSKQPAKNIKNDCPFLYNFLMAMTFCDKREDVQIMTYMWFEMIYNDFTPFKHAGLLKGQYDNFKKLWPNLKEISSNMPKEMIQTVINTNYLNFSDILQKALDQKRNHCIDIFFSSSPMFNSSPLIEKGDFEEFSPYNYFLMNTVDILYNKRLELISELYRTSNDIQEKNMFEININWALTHEIWRLIKNS